MRSTPLSLQRHGLVLAACALAAGCGTVDTASRSIADRITPYRVEIVQGNFISSEQVDLLKQGMTRLQVREVLGTPLLTDLFHGERWDYVFTMRRQGVDVQQRRLTLHFKGEALDRWEGDRMPAETEFVAAINKRRDVKVPPMEATEEQLRKAGVKPVEAAPSAPVAPPPAPAPARVDYPPLEPTR